MSVSDAEYKKGKGRENMSNYRPGDSNQINREYIESLLIEMRHIDSDVPSTKLELYGETFETPIMSAALSKLDTFVENGTVEMAKGVRDANGVMWIGVGDEAELESIIDTGVKTIKIIKPYENHDFILNKMKHAEKYGAIALGMDIDHAFSKSGQYDHIRGEKMTPKNFEDIKSFVDATELPFIIKGVLSETDALKCIEAGVKGIVVSHHHGILDYAIPPLMVLPKIVEVVNKRIPIFVDCGMNSGSDAFKALALGADAVCAGRILIEHLIKNNSQGVTNKINSMTEELAGILAGTGCKDIINIDNNIIRKK